jgi:hypothetical protein
MPLNGCETYTAAAISRIRLCARRLAMDLTNETYTIIFHLTSADGSERTERYYKDKRSAHDAKCWVKVSTRGSEFRATAEQVLNHLLPALAGLKPRLSVEVRHHPTQEER